jgi:hypothetical protein
MFSGEQQSVPNATIMLASVSLFYWVDVVALLNYTGILSNLGWSGRNVIFVGGVCIVIAHIFMYMPRATKILSDTSLESSQYRIFRYIFFCLPVVIFFVMVFLTIRFSTKA